MTRFVLASGSQIRRQVLENAEIPFEIIKPDVDEAVIKAERADLTPAEMALVLGEAKSEAVSRQHPDALVLGADQTMELDGQLLDKLPDAGLARDRLKAMRGKPHHLHSGLALFRNGRKVWTWQQTSALHVRDFSDEFLESYLEKAGWALTASVGAYAYEGLGAQLFERVEGDYYAIIGLPLLPLLAVLREEGVLPS
ncbi:MAG: Maf family protein [Alphaproteobacteria bacterium]|uniref:Maf family protein n=1 Tax=Maricaulis alexandrii TaxID=2570354 RepID=UPI001108724D|nr:nucleoside triphosphate pyrophosphatase [Maricaulis alexandrii]MCR9266045.1 Maf family protein [Alphaproteobacteria bacterium]